jgi:tetratricopeptide (TPR) repeat protein
MKPKIIYLFLCCSLLLNISCTTQHQAVDRILNEAEILVEQHPDSALELLDSILCVPDLGKSQYYHYHLLLVQAKDKSYQDITSDTVIFKVKEYYSKKKNQKKVALAAYYCGRVLQDQKKYEQAILTYLKAESYSKKSKDVNLKGLIQGSIGEVYYDQLLKDDAIYAYKVAKLNFHQAKNYKNEIITYSMLGNCFMLKGENDSAFCYYRKGLALADQHGITEEQVGLREGIGVAYREIKDYRQSKAFFKKALTFHMDSLEKARLYYNLALVSEQENHDDSARYYIGQSLTSLPKKEDNFLMANIYQTWSTIEERDGNYLQALEYERKYTDYLIAILDEDESKAVMEIQKKYDFQLLQNRNIRLQIERQRLLLVVSLLLLSLFILFFLFYRRSVRRREELLNAEQRIYQLKELARSFDEREVSFRSVLLRHFEILKKAALLEGYLKEEEKKKAQHLLRRFNEIVYGEESLDWDLLYRTMNDLQDGIFDRLRKLFSQLDELEFRICCLAYAEFSNTEIGILLKYQTNTVKAKKSVVRKKIGVETAENFHDFLARKLKS